MVTTLSQIKLQVTHLLETNPKVHIVFRNGRFKTDAEGIPAVITAAYRNLFTVRIEEDGIEKSHTFQYVEILTNALEIKELNTQEAK